MTHYLGFDLEFYCILYLAKDINIMGIRSMSDYLAEQNLGVRKRKMGKGEEKAKETWLNFTA